MGAAFRADKGDGLGVGLATAALLVVIAGWLDEAALVSDDAPELAEFEFVELAEYFAAVLTVTAFSLIRF